MVTKQSRPLPTDKIGKKIDYITKDYMFEAIKTLGFKQKSRTLFRSITVNSIQIVQVINIQGDKWNTGSFGKFIINIGLYFPAISKLLIEIPYYKFLQPGLDRIDEAYCQIRARLSDVLPENNESWWLPEMIPQKEMWFIIGDETDLDEVGSVLSRAIVEYVVPWMDDRSSLDKLITYNDKQVLSTGAMSRIVASIILGDLNSATEIFKKNVPSAFRTDEIFQQIKKWCLDKKLAVEDTTFLPKPLPPVFQARIAESDKIKNENTKKYRDFISSSEEIGTRIPELLEAFLSESRVKKIINPRSLKEFEIGQLILLLPDERKIQILCQTIAALTKAPVETKSTFPNVWGNVTYGHDYHWGHLIKGLLRLRLELSENAVKEILDYLPLLIHRHTHDYTLLSYQFPFAEIIKYLNKSSAVWKIRFKDSVESLLNALLEMIKSDSYLAKRVLLSARPKLFTGSLAAFEPNMNDPINQAILSDPSRASLKKDREAIQVIQSWRFFVKPV